MYRRLEAEQVKTESEDTAPEEICICTCKSEQAADEDPQPEAVFMGTRLAVDLDING